MAIFLSNQTLLFDYLNLQAALNQQRICSRFVLHLPKKSLIFMRDFFKLIIRYRGGVLLQQHL